MERLLEQEEDELEFSVCLPSPTLEPTALLTNDHTEPVVFILGWEGATDDELSEYSCLYEERGCVTIRYTAPVHCLHRREETRPLAFRLASLLEELCLVGSPVFVHALGCGGAGVYQYLGPALTSLGHSLSGLVCDSGPVEQSLSHQYTTLFNSLADGNAFARHGYCFFLVSCSQLKRLVARFASFLCLPLPSLVLSPAQHVASESHPPALFLHSPDDRGLEEVALSRETAGGKVARVCWRNSQHLMHLSSHRESYISTLLSFLMDCLGQ